MNNIFTYSDDILNIFSLIIVLIAIILISPCFFSKRIERLIPYKNNLIPNVIIQTYSNKDKIPSKVYKNISTYGQGYKHVVFDDYECIQFLLKEYGIEICNKFKSLKVGAHKSDLFRYCYLYRYGGVYLDIKTELIKPIKDIFKGDFLFTVISKSKRSIYQGVLVSKPKNPIFISLIQNILSNPEPKYSDFIIYFYNLLYLRMSRRPKQGINKLSSVDFIYLFQEVCTVNLKEVKKRCYDGLDRYGRCCLIHDKNQPIIKTRYSDFPW